jgi:hypothetical protein
MPGEIAKSLDSCFINSVGCVLPKISFSSFEDVSSASTKNRAEIKKKY